MINPRLHY